MQFSTIFTSSALMGLALAADHTVKVGTADSKLVFEPSNVQAAEGDTVTFHFWPKNHSVAQATFAKPCEPMENGFWSGYIPTTSGVASDAFVYKVTNASKPIWFYCTQGKHCQNGMVGAINAPATGNTIEKFAAAAKAAANNVEPTSKAPVSGEIQSNNNSSSDASPTPSSSGSASSTASTTPGAATPEQTGAASALAVGKGLIFTGAFALLGYLL
ncbi:Cupredoxin [Delitschia confertaspora ATCC 74209]|uniref:Cupredoxin n=1 Tax=Delitschia confertaspora ATCC 74209 TaxID=1513339 RepID=A0A9P4JAK5_9PLEO|nr:Cupredoxin [Delitschia confertaspora ATCC 74209]